MRKLTSQEKKALIIIFFTLFVVTFYNLQISIRKARDAQRRSDLGAISDALNQFYTDYGFFPPSVDGKIVFCKANNYQQVLDEMNEEKVFDRNKFLSGLRPCLWGKDSFADLFDEQSLPYLQTIPSDPKTENGVSYLYFSDTKLFQIYSYLEGKEAEDTYNRLIIERNILCGNKTCSYGKSFMDIPLNISIEEYEAMLIENKQKK